MSFYLDAHIHSANLETNTQSIISLDPRNIDQHLIQNHFFTLGLHPWWINEAPIENVLSEINKLKTHQNFIALGECGLDRHRNQNFNVQVEVFKQQLLYAKQNNIPCVTLHCVRAFSDILEILKEVNYLGNLFFHDYNGNPETTETLLQLNSYFSLGFKILDAKTKAARSLNIIPINRLFLETDNFEVSLHQLYEHTAKIKNLTVHGLQLKIIENFSSCFHKKF
jgi:TatD DNase family protein